MISKQDSNVLKGIAILGIIIHNLFHLLPSAVQENEFRFDLECGLNLLESIQKSNLHIIINLFSHFGHYGVPVFLFLSGSGLVWKYEPSLQNNISPQKISVETIKSLKPILPTKLDFMCMHVRKLWELMIPALLLFIVTQYIFSDGLGKPWSSVLRLVTFTATLFPSRNTVLGPWWFFSLILQCYFLYRFVFVRFRSSWVIWIMTSISLLFQMVLYYTDLHFNWHNVSWYALEYYRYNAPGHLLAFAFGIEAARREWMFPLWIAPVGVVLTVVSAFNVWLWFFSPLFAVIGTVPWIQLLRRHAGLYNLLASLGAISAAIFAFHPIVRHYLILPACDAVRHHQYVQLYGVICLYLVLVLSLALLYQAAMRRIHRKRGARS